MVLVKNFKFFPFFYLRENRQENTFHDILERKNAFSEYKNKRLNGCGPKFKIFPSFYFKQNRPGKCVSSAFPRPLLARS